MLGREPGSLQISASGAGWESCLCDLASTAFLVLRFWFLTPGYHGLHLTQPALFRVSGLLSTDLGGISSYVGIFLKKEHYWEWLFHLSLFYFLFGRDVYILCVVQYILRPVFHSVISTSTPQPILCSLPEPYPLVCPPYLWRTNSISVSP